MPIPPDETLPADSTASTSSTSAHPGSPETAQDVLEKFRQLNTEAVEEGDDSDIDGDEEGHGEQAVTGATDVYGAVGTGTKKKKKKKKGKASKAVAKLK